jgi:hypothetical protein
MIASLLYINISLHIKILCPKKNSVTEEILVKGKNLRVYVLTAMTMPTY